MKIVGGLLLSLLVALLSPTLSVSDDVDKEVIGTLFTVVGVIFSVGMSLIISVSSTGVKNKDARIIFRSQLSQIRTRFIIVFVLLSLFFILLPKDGSTELIDLWKIKSVIIKLSSNIFQVSCLLLSILYYIVNFYSIQSSLYDLQDRIENGE